MSNVAVLTRDFAPQPDTARVAQALTTHLARGLTPQDMIRVNAARPSFLTIDAGQSLYFQGDDCRNIYLLLDGWAFRHHILEDGRRQILDFALPGVIFGLPGSGIMSHSLECLTPCTFSVFTPEQMMGLMRDIPALGFRLLETLAGAEARAFEHLTSVGRRTAKERVAHLLLELVRRLGDNGRAAQNAMTLPLMLPHIADALGLTSETVCRALAAMRKAKVLVLRGQKLDVLNLARLAETAGVSL